MPTSEQKHPLDWLDADLARLERVGLRRQLAERGSAQGARVVLDGCTLVNFGSNDYLGLAGDPRLVAAAVEAARQFGWGGGASPLVSGRATPHAALERELAAFEGAEAALLFPSGFAANAGTIPALVGPRDAIYGDAKNHASLIDGCRLAGAERFTYPHADVATLGEMLAKGDFFRRRLIVTDSLFSMDGDIASLGELAALAEQHDAMLLVDEAHATGVFGPNGRGVVEAWEGKAESGKRKVESGKRKAESGKRKAESGKWKETFSASGRCEPSGSGFRGRGLIRVGTLSKALGSAGGFVCGERRLIDWLANRVRPYVFSTAPPPAVAAASSAALRIVQAEPHRRRELLDRAARLRGQLTEQGWNTGLSESQIIPLIVGKADEAVRLSATLQTRGYFVPGIRPPTVPHGQSLLRISLCWHHDEEMIAGLIALLDELRGHSQQSSCPPLVET